MYYSLGKKKRHTTVKNQFTVNNRGYILHKIRHKKGRKHDYDIYKSNHLVTPKEVVNVVVDLGYLGIEKDFPESTIRIALQKEEKPRRFITRRKRV